MKCKTPNGPIEFPDDSMIGSNNVKVTGSTTTSQWPAYNPAKTDRGWECPRCNRINAPWVRQCDCSNTWNINTTWSSYPPQNNEKWKTYVTCQQIDNVTSNPNVYQVGGSDYKEGNTYVNVSGTQSNEAGPEVTAWSCTNPDNCYTPHYTTKTVVNDNLEPLTRHFKD